jgi:hypothetical protein
MDAPRHPWRLAALLALAGALTSGCNLASLSYFLSGGGESKQDATLMELVPPENGKEAKVVILAYSGLDMRPEFVTVERELSGLLTRQITQASQANKQKVSVISPTKIQEFKSNHPDWHTLKLEDIGKRFDANYVIYLEIEHLSLYEQGSANQLYRGRADISVTLVNMQKPDEDHLEKHFSCEYPSARGPIPVDDKNPREFCLEFLNYVSQRLSWYFVAHPFKQEVCE